MNAPAIANAKRADLDWLSERRTLYSRQNRIIDWQFHTQLGQARAEGGDGFELSDFGIIGHSKAGQVFNLP
jgi:hypothetical protein